MKRYFNVKVFSALMALPLLFAGAQGSAAANLSGNYLVTVKAHPAGSNGKTFCARLVEDGSVLGFKTSGTFTLVATGDSGRWFEDSRVVEFESVLGSNSFIVFSGKIGMGTIAGTTFVEVTNGVPSAGGNFSAKKGGC